MKPMKTQQCAFEGLQGLLKNRSRILPGRMNRIIEGLIPTSAVRVMMGKMMAKALSEKAANNTQKRCRDEEQRTNRNGRGSEQRKGNRGQTHATHDGTVTRE